MEAAENSKGLSPSEVEDFWVNGHDAVTFVPGSQLGTFQLDQISAEASEIIAEARCVAAGILANMKTLRGMDAYLSDICPQESLPRRSRQGAIAAGSSDPLRRSGDGVNEPLAASVIHEEREELLAELLFAARDLADSRIYPVVFGRRCMECREISDRVEDIKHIPTCRTGRVLKIIDSAVRLLRSNSRRSELTPNSRKNFAEMDSRKGSGQ